MMSLLGPELVCADGAHRFVAHPMAARDGSIVWVCLRCPHAKATR